ncbi:MAG: hypothetical protein KDB27_08970, partial [Planctomycetales bacterium]|nr:hypothetical protein [Planctomycetales bacterium]
VNGSLPVRCRRQNGFTGYVQFKKRSDAKRAAYGPELEANPFLTRSNAASVRGTRRVAGGIATNE